MNLKKVNVDNDLDLWDEILINSPDFYTIAHNPSLLVFLKETLGWSGTSFFIESQGQLIGIYQHCFVSPKKAVSMPHFSYGGIIRKDDKFTKTEIFQAIKGSLPKHFEIRGFESYSSYYDIDKVATYLELEQKSEEQLAVFKYNHRRKIKKAYKNGLEVSSSSNSQDMKLFYKVYAKNMLRLGSPVLSETFFLNLLKTYKYGEVQVFLVKLDKKVVGGAVVLSYHKFVEDCWLSTLSEYNKLYTSVLLYWEMIKDSINKEKRYFSFGRSSQNSSLLRFKRQWRPIERQLFFSYSEEKKIGLKQMNFLTSLWKFLPLRAANFIGPKIADKLY